MTATVQAIRVESYNANVKKLGHWTDANRFEVKARSGYALLDLRSPRIDGDIEVHLQADRSTIKLLVPEDAVVEQWDLTVTGRGKVKDGEAPPSGASGRRIRLVGDLHKSEVRVNRGGVAILAAMFSHEFVEDCRRAYREGGRPTVHDPADTHE
jgi:hypothetical protein